MTNPNDECVLCKESIEENASPAHKSIGWVTGFNPYPKADSGQCCYQCNQTEVIPARLAGFGITF
jgi:hypothetical protein